jgi:RNA polymerase sigma factor (sigma-70 family)
MVTADLLSRARAGDGEAFRELTGPHRRELQLHCYRMLGSFADAEDAVQETMLAAWQGIGGFTEQRASLRTWLYKIATNRCLNARRAASRRPAREWDMSRFEPPVPTPRDEPVWLQPFPDALLEGAVDVPPGPEARYEQTEAISLAFVTALQLLPPRQVAVLIRDRRLPPAVPDREVIQDGQKRPASPAHLPSKPGLHRGPPDHRVRRPCPQPVDRSKN